MKRPAKRPLPLLLPPALLALAAACALVQHQTPPGQPPLATMDLAALRADFNRALDRPRLIVLFSPT